MRGGILIVGLLVLVMLISGCSTPVQELTCNKPYIKVGKSCCFDQDDNSISL